MLAVLEILSLLCELLSVRQTQIETNKSCPPDLKEAAATVAFVAARLDDLPELATVSAQLANRFGRAWAQHAAADATSQAAGVNHVVLQKLSVVPPSHQAAIAALQEIATEHGLEWTPKVLPAEVAAPPTAVHESFLAAQKEAEDAQREADRAAAAAASLAAAAGVAYYPPAAAGPSQISNGSWMPDARQAFYPAPQELAPTAGWYAGQVAPSQFTANGFPSTLQEHYHNTVDHHTVPPTAPHMQAPPRYDMNSLEAKKLGYVDFSPNFPAPPEPAPPPSGPTDGENDSFEDLSKRFETLKGKI